MTIAGQDMRENYGTIALMGVETFLLTQGITSLAKVIFHRTRPYAYNPSVSIEERLQKDARASFFSGHTSQAAAGCFFFAAVYQQYNPTSKARFVVWSLAAAIPAVVGFMRVHSGKHFLTDVLVGYGVGASVGILVPRLHR
jgi:membrane-associated phospholipid phosphatase